MLHSYRNQSIANQFTGFYIYMNVTLAWNRLKEASREKYLCKIRSKDRNMFMNVVLVSLLSTLTHLTPKLPS